jgi:hypothetical protein
LRAASTDFRRLWAEHEVAVRRFDRKTLVHPRTPADAETRERLDLLRVLGIQEFRTARTGPPAR